MGRVLPVKFFPSSLLNLFSPPPFPPWKEKLLLLPTVLSSRIFLSTLLSLPSPHSVVYLTLPGFAGASPRVLSPPDPHPLLAKACRQCLLGLRVGPALPPVLLCALEYWFFSVCVRRLCKNQYFSSLSTARGSVMELACWCNVRGPPSTIEVRKWPYIFLFHCVLQREGTSLYTVVHQIPGQSKLSAVGWHTKLENDIF